MARCTSRGVQEPAPSYVPRHSIIHYDGRREADFHQAYKRKVQPGGALD
jgi:hypothetical protein